MNVHPGCPHPSTKQAPTFYTELLQQSADLAI